jgi:hypothetical protein
MAKINDYDLRKNKYDIETLTRNINHLYIKTIVNTQILTAEFCVKYILDEKYMTCIEDTYLIDFNYVLQKQPHITEAELREEYDNYYE